MYTFGKKNDALIEKFAKDPKFQEFVVPMNKLERIEDATFFVRHDGMLIFSEGYYHPRGSILGNIIYVPDEKGRKQIFGTPYSSIIKEYDDKSEEQWIPFEKQLVKYFSLDPALNVERPPYGEYKLLFNLQDFVGFVPNFRSMKVIRKHSVLIDGHIRDLANLMDMEPDDIGCTGSMSVGNFEDPHDYDLVFRGDLDEVCEMIDRIYGITEDTKHQVWEYGVRWAIRFYDDNGNMICPFFRYRDWEDVPLKDFGIEIVDEDREIEATIDDDTHSAYMPTVLPLTEVTGDDFPEKMHLLIYNGGLRGEYLKGNRISARGRLTKVTLNDTRAVLNALMITNLGMSKKV